MLTTAPSLRTARRASACTLALATALLAPAARAQDAGPDATVSLDGGTFGRDAGSREGGTPSAPMCPDAVDTVRQPVDFRRMGPVRFGPGTGMQMVGSRSSVGLEYNLLFSGSYDARMRGHLRASWPRPLTITAEPEPGGGSFSVRFGLRMVIALYVLGIRIQVPTGFVIEDMEGMMSTTFDPWAWNYEGTEVSFPVSAWREIYTYDLNVGDMVYPIRLSGRYGMKAYVRTVEIGFPDRDAPAMMDRNIAVITQSMPEALIPPPNNGRLALLTRWKPQVRYVGNIELKVEVLRRTCVLGFCTDIGFMAPTFPIARTEESLPDPYDQEPNFELPVQDVPDTEVNFGEVLVGTPAMNSIRVNNPGAAVLGVRTSPPGDSAFTVGPGACVRPGSMQEIPVTFTPSRAGTFRTEVLLESNGIVGTPHRVTLYGIGVTMRPPGGTGTTRPDGGSGVALPDGGVLLPDGAVGSPDGGREYRGGRVEAGCACRVGETGATSARGGRIALALSAAFGLTLALRSRGRARRGGRR